MLDHALANTKNFDKSSFFLFSMIPESFYVASDKMVTRPTP